MSNKNRIRMLEMGYRKLVAAMEAGGGRLQLAASGKKGDPFDIAVHAMTNGGEAHPMPDGTYCIDFVDGERPSKVRPGVSRYEATMRAKSMAQGLGIDLRGLTGTGIDGKITVDDVRSAAHVL